ncbi:MAG: hypothetical protein COA75_11330 [Cellvibrionales bacterium]|nr:MAG: hypothetical protein COA75_11330 [Cellvibrionales bacterium]
MVDFPVMNKPAHLQENVTDDTIRKNKVNRNLSPSFAKIQALGNKPPPINIKTSVSEEESRPRTDETKLASLKTHHTATDNNAAGEQPPFLAIPSTSETRLPSPANPARLTPWIIASITLTMALFSGNYAWDTQQKVDKLSHRLEILETRPTPPEVVNLPGNSDTLARTEQEILTLSHSQEQLSTAIEALQNTSTTDIEQASSRLTTLEAALADLNSKVKNAELNNEINQAPVIRTDASQPNTKISNETKDGKVIVALADNNAANNSAVESWFINIASFSDAKTANSIFEKAHKIEAKTSIQPITVNGKTLYRIRADGFTSREKAEQQAQDLQTQLGLTGLWISRD